MAAVVAEQDKGMEVVAMSRELSTYEAMGGTYTEADGVFYPNIVVSEEADVWIGKYGLLWIDYMKSNHAERYRHHIRMGTLSARAFELNEEAYEMLEGIVSQYLAKHKPAFSFHNGNVEASGTGKTNGGRDRVKRHCSPVSLEFGGF